MTETVQKPRDDHKDGKRRSGCEINCEQDLKQSAGCGINYQAFTSSIQKVMIS